MFDKSYFSFGQTRTQYVTKEVHEHRAPTDESVKLLREMEAASEAKRIESLKLTCNGFTAHVEVFRDFALGYQTKARAVFDLNGVRMQAEAAVDDGPNAKRELAEALRAAISEQIANAIIAQDAIVFCNA